MPLHLLRAKPLGEQLANDAVPAQDQAFYLSASFVLWLLPSYLYISPPPNFDAWSIHSGLWLYELFTLIMIYIFGIRYCLAKCGIESRRNFLIDFSCLYAPVSLSTLIAVWSVFHVYAWLVPWWLRQLTFETRPYAVEFFYSARFFDLMRYFAVVASVFIVIARIGRHMGRISKLRASGLAPERTRASAARAESNGITTDDRR
jgi:hypothetical protein